MFCPKCGCSVDNNVAFCPQCGAPLNAASQGGYNQQNAYNQPNGNAQQMGFGGFCAPIGSKNIALCIILSIVTCGIYSIVWFIGMVNDLNTASDNPGDTSGGMVFLLMLVTCGIYGFYWFYKAGEKVSYIRRKSGDMTASNNGILYLILAIFGLSIVNYCLIQSELNRVAMQ